MPDRCDPSRVVIVTHCPGVSSSRLARLLNPRLISGNPPGCHRCALRPKFKLDKFSGSAWLAAMKIPEFKPSRRFLGDYAVPCLIAKVKNSALPGIASRYISQFKKDPICTIYLRGADAKKVSAWQQEMLVQLFGEGGLATAVAEGIKELEAQHGTACYSDRTEDECQSIKVHGYLPFLWVDLIVIDEVEQRVMLRPDDVAGPLHEHGATIFLREGRWRYEENHLNDYEGSIDEMLQAQEDQKLQQRYGRILPPTVPETPVDADATGIFGQWRFDQAETVKLLRQLKASQREIEEAMASNSYLLDGGYRFSPTKWEYLRGREMRMEFEVVGLQRKGNWFTVRGTSAKWGKPTERYWCDGKLLVAPTINCAYSRASG